jgi:hypothetical protein
MHLSPGWLMFPCLLSVGVRLSAASEKPGIKMTLETGRPELPTQRTVYLRGDRKRVEFQNTFGRGKPNGSQEPIRGPHLVVITRCDLGQSFELNLDTHEYTAHTYPPKPLTKEELEGRGLKNPIKYISDQPTLRIETTTTDTGERKEIFGKIARHVITTRKQTPLEGSHSLPQESVTDGWYIDSSTGEPSDIDLNQRLSCDRKWTQGKPAHAHAFLMLGNQPQDRPEFVDVGELESGFALQSVMTSSHTFTRPDGTQKQSDSMFETKVTAFEEGPIDLALFEIPSGFEQVEKMERNPPASEFAAQPPGLWQWVKASVSLLFTR